MTTPIAPLGEIIGFIVGTISNDPVLQGLGHSVAWSHQAPSQTPFPYFIIQKQSDNYRFTLDSGRAFDQHFISVKSVTRNNIEESDGGELGRLANERAREILFTQRPTLSNGYTMRIRESNGFEYREAEDGNRLYYHVGTVYAIMMGY